MEMFSLRPQRSCLKQLITFYLFIFSLYLTLITLPFNFNHKSNKSHANPNSLISANPNSLISTNPAWFDLLAKKINTQKLKVGLVNLGDDIQKVYDNFELVETVIVDFEPVKDKKWEDFFPEWIDEAEKWGPPRCPEIPMPPRMEDYRGLDVVVAGVPCGGGGVEKEGIRNIFRLQVNLVVANLVAKNGLVGDRTVYVVFMGSCGPMQEIFRCDDMVTRVGDYWVYKPELRKLKQKMLMPVGTCQIAPPYAKIGDEYWRPVHRKVAYATILHSSEAYVCGAIALAQSIIQTNSTKDLILLHDSSITQKSLKGIRSAGWETRLINPIRNPSARKGSYNEWNYSKLRLWQLTEYEKIIFIDSDIVVLKNIDYFFLYPQLSASANDKFLFNSGIMVIEPSECTFRDLMLKIPKLESYNGGDQGFLNEAFTWWHRLPSRLNYLKFFAKEDEKNKEHEIPDDILAIHFLGWKPWMCYKDYDCNWDMKDRHVFASDSAHRKWWNVYEGMPEKLHKYCGLNREMEVRIRKWRKMARKGALPDGHWKIDIQDSRRRDFIQ